MRLPRVWTSLRLMLVVVSVVGITLGTWVITSRRRATFSERAGIILKSISGSRMRSPPTRIGRISGCQTTLVGDTHPDRSIPPGWSPPSAQDPPPIRAWRMSQERRIAYHQAMKQKYERASRYPWLPVLPDPPEPE